MRVLASSVSQCAVLVSDSCSLPSATESMKPFLRCTALSASGLPSRMTTLPTGPRADFDALFDRLGDRRDHRLRVGRRHDEKGERERLPNGGVRSGGVFPQQKLANTWKTF